MKRLYVLIAACILTIASFNCQREANNGLLPAPGSNGNSTNAAPIKATLQGNVYDENGQPAIGVSIKVGAKTATTNARGYFRIVDASLDKNASLVSAEKTGYFKAFRSFSATSAVNQVMIKLIKKTVVGTIDASAGGTVTLTNGSKITLPANGVVKAAGGSYSGSVKVYAAYIDPTASDITKVVPGSFMANDKDNKRVLLSSYGMLAVELESASGEKLQVASGHTATLTSPIPSSLLSSAPSTIKLWFVDEQTGLWKEEGEATKSGSNYTGEVKHFTYWNCDVPVPTVTASATFVTPQGEPLVYAEIHFVPVGGNYYGVAHGYTDSAGHINGPVPANMNLILQVIDACGNTVFSQNVGPYSSNTDLGTITIPSTTVSLITVKGKLVNCSNAPVTDGFAIINYNNITRYASVNNTGDFSVSFINCAGSTSPATGEITGVDAASLQQSTAVNVTISPVTDAGTITACGTSTAEYISYNLDGTSHNIVDSLIAFTQSTSAPYQMFFNGASYQTNTGNNNALTLAFASDGVVGTYPLTSLTVETHDNTELVAPATITITNYPQAVGEFYEGSFTAQFKDAGIPAPVYTISGSFRLRKNQ